MRVCVCACVCVRVCVCGSGCELVSGRVPGRLLGGSNLGAKLFSVSQMCETSKKSALTHTHTHTHTRVCIRLSKKNLSTHRRCL